MSRTVTALYDTRQEAERARERLESEFDVDSIDIHDQNSRESEGGSSWLGNTSIPDDDRHAYGEGVSRGGFLLCAEVDGDEDANRIVEVLEQSSPVDFGRRQEQWRSEGWQPGSQQGQSTGQRPTAEGGQRTVEEERIPIVEEQMKVGKREVEQGGARVRSYVREVPVNEQVLLREENVDVERRPVDQAVRPEELERQGLLQEREVEMHATSEEPVIGKEARVNEEVILRKTQSERSENVQDTVRKTEVDVEGDEGRSRR